MVFTVALSPSAAGLGKASDVGLVVFSTNPWSDRRLHGCRKHAAAPPEKALVKAALSTLHLRVGELIGGSGGR
jgi:hypothetical protein